MAGKPPLGFTLVDSPSSGSGKPPPGFTVGNSEPKKPMINPALKEALSRVPGLLEKLSPVIPGLEPLTTAAEFMPAAKTIKEGFPKVAGNIAEALGKRGVSPNVSAAITTPIAIAPELGSAALGLGEMAAGEGTIAQAIRNTPRMLSKRYEALKGPSGISKNLPERLGAKAKFPALSGLPSDVPPVQTPTIAPIKYPKSTNSFLNFARARMEGLGNKLSPQELNDYKSILNTAINEGEVVPGTDQFAIASELRKTATQLLNKAIPERAELDKIYALSKKLRIAPEVAKKLWDYLGPKMRWGSILVP